MSRRKGGSLTEDWYKLKVQLEKGKPSPIVLPTELLLTRIQLYPSVFQHRNPNRFDGKTHIRKLAEAINRSTSRTLEPITVWWNGKAWTCIDGHHRHAAYQTAGVERSHPVPVTVFVGSLGEAVAQAAAGNSKNKLAMTTAEKAEAAWRMVVMDHTLSKPEVAAASGVSLGSIANMRRAHKQLSDLEEEAGINKAHTMISDHRDLKWIDARRLAQGGDAQNIDWAAKDEKDAEVMAVAILKAIGKLGRRKPHVFARALELYDSRTEDMLMDYWGHHNNDSDDDDDDS